MSSSKDKPLREVINQMLRAYGLGDRLDEVGLLKSWEEVVGKMIAQHTSDLYFKKGVLYVTLDSASLRQELTYVKSSLLEKLNQKAGKNMVQEINFK